MLRENKTAVIYGAGTRTLAREGAEAFLTGRGRNPVDAPAKEIVVAGGLIVV